MQRRIKNFLNAFHDERYYIDIIESKLWGKAPVGSIKNGGFWKPLNNQENILLSSQSEHLSLSKIF